MKKIILGVISDLDVNIVPKSYIEKLKNLTDFWIFNATHNLKSHNLQVDIVYFDTEDHLLSYAVHHNYDFCIGNWIGHLLRPAQLDNRHVIIDTINLCENSDGLLGHIISYDQKVPYFYKEFWCVNMKIYKEIGCPTWESNNLVFPNFIRSTENFHDNYTPFYLNPFNGVNNNEFQLKWGTGLIEGWLLNQKAVLNFPTSIRELKHHLYPENHEKLAQYFDSKISVNELTQPLQKEYFRCVDYANAKNCIFLFNTDTLNFTTPSVKIDNLISVCAAFRPYLILFKSGFDQSTKVKFIDYSQISLDFKQWLVENWDGYDIGNAVALFEKHVGQPISWNRPFHETYTESYDKVISCFGSHDVWIDFWNQYKTLHHEFHLIDLVNDVSNVLPLFESNQNYIYFSNSFNTEAALIKWGKSYLQTSFEKLLNDAKEHNAIIDGSDIDHHYPDPNFFDIVKKEYICR